MKLPNIGFKDYLKSLIQNNSGHSSKTAAYLLGVATGCFCVLLITLYLGYDILCDGRIDTDMVAFFLCCFCRWGIISEGQRGKV